MKDLFLIAVVALVIVSADVFDYDVFGAVLLGLLIFTLATAPFWYGSVRRAGR